MFWKWVLNYKSELEQFIEGNREEGYKIYNQLTKKMKTVDSRIHPELTINDNGEYRMIISCDGEAEAIPIVKSLFSEAPEMMNWEIVKFRQPKDSFEIDFSGLKFPSQAVQVLYKIDDNIDKIHIKLLIENYDKEDNRYGSLAFLYLDHIIGEFNSMTKVGYIDLGKYENQSNTISLVELRKLIEDNLY